MLPIKCRNQLFNRLSRLEECESQKEELSRTLKETEEEKCSLKNELLAIQKENKDLQNKLIIDAKISDESINMLIKEKNELMKSADLLKDDLQSALLDKEKLSEVCSDGDNKLFEMTEKYEIAQQELKEMEEIKEKYNECLVKNKEYEDTLLSLTAELKSNEIKILELTVSEEKLNEVLIKIKHMEADLSSKNDVLISKEKCIEEMNSIIENYDLELKRLKKLEEVVKQKTELLQEEEKKIMDLTDILKAKEKELEKLEYENLEMKDSLEKEHESLKICLECEMLKDKLKELDDLRIALSDAERELNKEKLQASRITKMLSETEENFDAMRIKKEKEIIKCKDVIHSLQHELKILKVQVGEAEKLKHENDKLHLTIEEIKLQNAGDIQRLKAEIATLKAKENAILLNPEMPVPKKPISTTPVAKVVDQKAKQEEMMEPDSSDEVTIIDEGKSQMAIMNKKFSRVINRKVMIHPLHHSTPFANLARKKRAWETESSGSECLEIIFDKNAKKVAGLTPKIKSPHAANKSFVNMMSSEKKRDLLEITDMETPKKNEGDLNIVTPFDSKSTPQFKKTDPISSSKSMDFLFPKSSIKEANFASSPWREPVSEIKRTPATPADRKFFKTPLKERENSFKKPQLQKLWF